jgi:ribosomal protein L11 methylase PrmA
LHTYLHIHLHARLARNSEGKSIETKKAFSEKKLRNLIASLESLIDSLSWKSKPSLWEHYYEEASERKDYLDKKKEIVEQWLNDLPAIRTAADLGANEGVFSKMLAAKNFRTIASDSDHAAINHLYLGLKKDGEKNILPLIIDLANPSPASGLNNKERTSFIERSRVDLVLALALIHHLYIGKNIPFEKIATLLKELGEYIIIEFVPREDEKVKWMLSQKKDIYEGYTEREFAQTFERYFQIIRKQEIASSGRVLYLLKNA